MYLLIDPYIVEINFSEVIKSELEGQIRKTLSWYSKHGIEKIFLHPNMEDIAVTIFNDVKNILLMNDVTGIELTITVRSGSKTMRVKGVVEV